MAYYGLNMMRLREIQKLLNESVFCGKNALINRTDYKRCSGKRAVADQDVLHRQHAATLHGVCHPPPCRPYVLRPQRLVLLREHRRCVQEPRAFAGYGLEQDMGAAVFLYGIGILHARLVRPQRHLKIHRRPVNPDRHTTCDLCAPDTPFDRIPHEQGGPRRRIFFLGKHLLHEERCTGACVVPGDAPGLFDRICPVAPADKTFRRTAKHA